MDVFTVNVALVAPAGTVALEGTLAAPLLLSRAPFAPPAGAGPLSVTVAVEDCKPPITRVGFSVSEERVTVGAGGGVVAVERCSNPTRAGLRSSRESATSSVAPLT